MATWKPIVAGVDGSPQAAGAAALAWRIAGTAGTDRYFVPRAHPLLHPAAVPDFITAPHPPRERQGARGAARRAAALRGPPPVARQ